jgi:polysaccharide biosynthesis/export protein
MRGLLPLTVAAAGALAACTNTSNLPPAPTFPAPVREVYEAPYLLHPGDVLAVRLMLNPELNEDVTVQQDGRISTTVAADVPAAGRTVGELNASLRQLYKKDLSNPRINVTIRTFSPTRFYVGGEVVFPGEFQVTSGRGLSLSQVIARAGGVKPSADQTSIFIIRRGPTGTPPALLSTRYSDVVHAKDGTADVELAADDVVYVPKTGIAEVYQVYNQYIEQFAHPSFGFSYLLNSQGNNAVVTQPGTVSVTPAPAPAPVAR